MGVGELGDCRAGFRENGPVQQQPAIGALVTQPVNERVHNKGVLRE